MRNQVQREKSRCTKKRAAKHCPGQQKGQFFTQSPITCHTTSVSTVQPLCHPPVANCPLANSLPLPSPQKSVQGKCFHSHQYAQNVFQELIKSQSTDIFLYYEDKRSYFLLATRC